MLGTERKELARSFGRYGHKSWTGRPLQARFREVLPT